MGMMQRSDCVRGRAIDREKSVREKSVAKSELFRGLPSVDEVLRIPSVEALAVAHGIAPVTAASRAALARLREEVGSGRLDRSGLQLAVDGLHNAVETQLRAALDHSLRPVINATGVILHTNLGRAPLAESALAHIRETAGSFSNLEFDVEAGVRGKRDIHVDRLFRSLLADSAANRVGTAASAASRQHSSATSSPPPAVSTIVVNNNAAAVLLALNTLAEGGEVIVSRGELVEIGGSFRIPDVMAKSGATLREVGTTNMKKPSPSAPACCSACTAPILRSPDSPNRRPPRNWLGSRATEVCP